LTIEFADDERTNRADLKINDRTRSIEEEEKFFTLTLNDEEDPDLIEEGNNLIEIIPIRRLDIIEIRVEVKERD
jgi:hypothetical protein